MNQEQFEEIDRILSYALEIEPRARADFLNQACGDYNELRREVEFLLSKEEEAAKLDLPAIAYLANDLARWGGAIFAGQRISNYLIQERIGSGGMGEVWSAWDERLHRIVAIKVLPIEFSADPQYVRGFTKDDYNLAVLNHPNIITIYEIGQVSQLHFIATEFIEGQTLRDHLRQHGGAMSWREVVRIAAQIAGALSAAHAVGVLHRDIKPENVMIVADYHVKVVNFGIAKRASIAGVEIQLGVGSGTLRYMSPEQARGELLDERTDVFSLGSVLYEMIVGRHPCGDKSDDEIRTALLSDGEIPPISSVNDQIPAALDRIVTKALRKRREERYSSGDEMLADLERLKSLIEVGGEEKREQLLRALNANQLLTQFAVFYDIDKKTRIPLGELWTIWRFSDLKRGALEREVMRKSLLVGLFRAGWWILLIAAITIAWVLWVLLRNAQRYGGH